MTDAPDDDPVLNSLLEQANGGDANHLGRLLDHLRPLLRRRAEASLHGPLLARVDESDIVQQTCLSAVQQFPQFRGRSPREFVAWLLQIHEHNVVSVVRHHTQVQKRAVDREVRPETGDGFPGHAESSPSQRAMRGERETGLEAALQRLPDAQREAVRMRFAEGAPLASIAAELGKSEMAVAGLLKRGLQRLREILKDNQAN
jgi:RNA polymerase sigma-70 factor (ECF subfamily)